MCAWFTDWVRRPCQDYFHQASRGRGEEARAVCSRWRWRLRHWRHLIRTAEGEKKKQHSARWTFHEYISLHSWLLHTFISFLFASWASDLFRDVKQVREKERLLDQSTSMVGERWSRRKKSWSLIEKNSNISRCRKGVLLFFFGQKRKWDHRMCCHFTCFLFRWFVAHCNSWSGHRVFIYFLRLVTLMHCQCFQFSRNRRLNVMQPCDGRLSRTQFKSFSLRIFLLLSSSNYLRASAVCSTCSIVWRQQSYPLWWASWITVDATMRTLFRSMVKGRSLSFLGFFFSSVFLLELRSISFKAL